ncbi:MAG: DNA polymerase III subunit gamma/tau [Christensenellaceae bacterium]|jgi:DNA polymerase-3 subunit gamma/tau|nr:DNA polymerase III subunit gamma/tau [Christensenellaceae bacterium]
MAHVSLYRKYRPQDWKGVIGQDHIVKTLINQIKNNSVSHAYLFTGTRGTGKTSSAKIFARAINCKSPINGSPCGECTACKVLSNPTNTDIIEMDAASNNGVDEIRDLKESVQYTPTIGRYKVYIVDEVHMLSTAAFNALLKTLEEPPEHVVFILATTEVHKLPQTILSRCMRFDFRFVARAELNNYLNKIFKSESYKCDPKASMLIAEHGAGSVRDMLSIADMCMSYAPEGLKYEDTLSLLGVSDFDSLFDLAEAILDADFGKALNISRQFAEHGKSVSVTIRELASFFNDMIAVKNIKGYSASFLNDDYVKVSKLAEKFDNLKISRASDIFSILDGQIRYNTQPQIIFDAAIIRAAELRTDHTPDALLSRMTILEKKLDEIKANGIVMSRQEDLGSDISKNQNISSDKTQNRFDDIKEQNDKVDNKPFELDVVIEKNAVVIEDEPLPFDNHAYQEIQEEIELNVSAKETINNILKELSVDSSLAMIPHILSSGDFSLDSKAKKVVLKVGQFLYLSITFDLADTKAVIEKAIKNAFGDEFKFEIEVKDENKKESKSKKTPDKLKNNFGDKISRSKK